MQGQDNDYADMDSKFVWYFKIKLNYLKFIFINLIIYQLNFIIILFRYLDLYYPI